jgi:hypothetical protein
MAETRRNRIRPSKQRNEFQNRRSKVGRVGFEPTTPAMSRRYPNHARPPARKEGNFNFYRKLIMFFSTRYLLHLKSRFLIRSAFESHRLDTG